MKISQKGIDMLKQLEEVRLAAYLDIGGIPTIGYGHTRNVEMDDVITLERAEALLREDLSEAELCVERQVYYGLAPHQFDALVSLVFNIGINAFKKSTLLKKLDKMDILGAADEFLRWNKVKGKVSKGLTNRRKIERDVFLTGYK
jgi:lysozyme